MIKVTSANFETEVEKSSIPVIVVFGAAWNAPGNLIARQLDRLDQTKVKIAVVDIDASTDLSIKFSVRFCPYLMVFKDGLAVFTDNKLSDELLKAVFGA